MARKPLTREAVFNAVEEFRAIGRDAFLTKYGFGRSRDFFLEISGSRYDSKPIVGAAYGFIEGEAPLTSGAFSGGFANAVATLRKLGFNVVSDTKNMDALDAWSADTGMTAPNFRNPDWTWDEHVLALELYMRNPVSPPGKTSEEVVQLSRLLVSMGDALGVVRKNDYRNPNGVYMKMMNFRRLDPTFKEQGKKGLPGGAGGEAVVWERYAEDLDGLVEAAQIIRDAVDGAAYASATDRSQVVDITGAEGSIIVRRHVSRERNRKLIKAKKAVVKKRTGKLCCECCEFDFQAFYGDIGDGFIEVHHTDPIALSEPGRKTKLSELAVVCANCHRMLHRNGLQTIEWLRANLRA